MGQQRTTIALSVLLMLSYSYGYEIFRRKIPNGELVPHPCRANHIWKGVGHRNALGGGQRNPFGVDFDSSGKKWTKELCQKDSDGDGLSNGQELGDPDCTWVEGGVAKNSVGLSHPGVCEPWDSSKCIQQNAWLDCSSDEFKCDALSEDGMQNMTVRYPETEVPNTETNYFCMLFDLPTDGDFHLVATKPMLDNEQVMHHIVIYGCDESEGKVNTTYLNKPRPCGMSDIQQCSTIIALWTVGVPGECSHPDAGFRIGQQGMKRAVMQFHWNNPSLLSGQTDSSGMTFFYTANKRKHDAGVLQIGQLELLIPPGKEKTVETSSCPGEMTRKIFSDKIYITEAFNHMHYLGRSQTIELYRNGIKVQDITNEPNYSYDSPKIYDFENTIEVFPGDELKTTCTFTSIGKAKTVFYGEGTSDEMCFGFLKFFPLSNANQTNCASFDSIPLLKVWQFRDEYKSIDGCYYNDFFNENLPHIKALTDTVFENCHPFTGCLTECKAVVKELKSNNPCFKGDIAKFIRKRYMVYFTKKITLMFAAVDSCDAEIAVEAALSAVPLPETNDPNISSLHIGSMNLIIITLLANYVIQK